MPRQEQTATVTTRIARVFANLTPDAADLLAPLCIEHDIAVSPQLAGWITGRSAHAVRKAVDERVLPTAGARKHRFVRLSALAAWTHNPVTPSATAAAFRRATVDCTFAQFLRDRPLSDPEPGAPLSFDPVETERVRIVRPTGPAALLEALHRAVENGRAAAGEAHA